MDPVKTLVFDEIDSGISGQAAGRVAAHLVRLAKSKQAYCLVVFFEQGWLSCNETEVKWLPLDFLQVEELYCPLN